MIFKHRMERREFLETAGKSGLSIILGGSSFVLTGCDVLKIFDPSWVTAIEIEPLPEFRQWWNEISKCASRSGDFNRIHWFHVQEEYIPCILYGGQSSCFGIWKRPHDIYLANIVFTRYNQGTHTDSYQWAKRRVQHEMLHDLLDKGLLDNGNHPQIFKKCPVR